MLFGKERLPIAEQAHSINTYHLLSRGLGSDVWKFTDLSKLIIPEHSSESVGKISLVFLILKKPHPL